MAPSTAQRIATLSGITLGVALAVALAWAARVPAGTGSTGADVTFTLAPTGEVGVAGSGRALRAAGLRSGSSARGGVSVRNQSPRAVAVRLRARPSGPALDRLLTVEVGAGGETLYRGALAGLRAWTPPFRLARGAGGRLSLSARVIPAAGRAADGLAVDVPLELRSRPVGE